MTDQDKINWFNNTAKWVEDNGGIEGIEKMAESSSTAPYEIFYDFLEQLKNNTKT